MEPLNHHDLPVNSEYEFEFNLDPPPRANEGKKSTSFHHSVAAIRDSVKSESVNFFKSTIQPTRLATASKAPK